MTAPEPWPPLIVAVAPNGARLGRADHPALPLTPAELAAAAGSCLAAGAALLHLHVRDAEGRHSLDPADYRPAMVAVRAAVGDRLVLQVTTEAAGRFDRETQMAAIRALVPEAVSIAVRELAPDPAAEPAMAGLAAWMAERAVSPQYILYDPGDVRRFADLLGRAVIHGERASVLFVLGRYAAGQRSQPADLLPFLEAWRPLGIDLPWFVCAFGPMEQACAIAAAALGGHVRVGFENNRQLADGRTAPDNAALVAQAAAGAAVLARPLADAAAARRILAPGGR